MHFFSPISEFIFVAEHFGTQPFSISKWCIFFLPSVSLFLLHNTWAHSQFQQPVSAAKFLVFHTKTCKVEGVVSHHLEVQSTLQSCCCPRAVRIEPALSLRSTSGGRAPWPILKIQSLLQDRPRGLFSATRPGPLTCLQCTARLSGLFSSLCVQRAQSSSPVVFCFCFVLSL